MFNLFKKPVKRLSTTKFTVTTHNLTYEEAFKMLVKDIKNETRYEDITYYFDKLGVLELKSNCEHLANGVMGEDGRIEWEYVIKKEIKDENS